jgi:hypothetical protein
MASTDPTPSNLVPRTARRRASTRVKPFWERGFKSHGYWLGKIRIGHVQVEPGKSLEMKYQWTAGTHTGQTTTLKEAKQMVEQTLLQGGRQLVLFDDEPLILSPQRAR